MRIGLLSDTHGFLLPPLLDFLSGCDELWHAGDIGNWETLQKLQAFKPLRAVYGNIDGQEVRRECPEELVFTVEGLKVCMTHIGGYPDRYSPRGRQLIQTHRPGLFVSGHSHILKAMPDRKYNLLHLNPGAAGFYGWHRFTTAMRFSISNGVPSDLEIYQVGRDEAARFRPAP